MKFGRASSKVFHIRNFDLFLSSIKSLKGSLMETDNRAVNLKNY